MLVNPETGQFRVNRENLPISARILLLLFFINVINTHFHKTKNTPFPLFFYKGIENIL